MVRLPISAAHAKRSPIASHLLCQPLRLPYIKLRDHSELSRSPVLTSGSPTIRPLRELSALRKGVQPTTNIPRLEFACVIARNRDWPAVETNFNTIVQWWTPTASQGDRCIRTVGGSVVHLEAAQSDEPSIRRAAIIAGLAPGGTLLACAQGGNADGKTAEQAYKNVQVHPKDGRMTFLAASINAQFNRTRKTREAQASLGKL
jgi:hypothetical protein